MDLTNTMKRVVERMRVDYEEARESISHKGDKGGAIEEVVKDHLRKYFPKFLGIGTGEIVTADTDLPEEEQVSSQMDIVIYDSLRCPTFYRTSNVQVFPNEGVYGVIEVKSKLDSDGLEDDIGKIAMAKRMPKFSYYDEAIDKNVGPVYGKYWDYFPTIGAIFAFDSLELETILGKLCEINKEKGLELHEQVDLIFVLNRGLIDNVEFDVADDHFDVSCRPTPSTVRVYTKDDRSLLFFYVLLMQHLAQARMKPIKMAGYGDFSNVTSHFGSSVELSDLEKWFRD